MRTDVDAKRPIGIFDSGLGGLTVAKAIMRELPHEDIVYFGDTARVPYGTKSPEAIIQFSKENAAILYREGVKAIVVACNSSTSYALHILKKMYAFPVVGVIEPGAKKAALSTRSGKIGVIATMATVNSGQYAKAIKNHLSRAKIFSQPCPLFVPLAEEGWLDKKVTADIAREYLNPLRKKSIDTLILGCTHYPLLKNTIRKVMGHKVNLIDSAQEVAKEVKSILEKKNLLRTSKTKPKHKFLVSDKPQAFKKIANRFLGKKIHV